MIKNERGSATLFAIWMLGLTAIFLILIVNIIKVYAAKEQASMNAEQAALSATDVVYDAVSEVIDDYEGPELENVDDLIDLPDLGSENKLQKEIDNKKEQLENSEGLYENQAEMEAIDMILTKKLSKAKYENLKENLEEALTNITDDMENVADQVIVDNNGETSETILYYFNNENRIEVKTESSFDGVQYQEFFAGVSDNVPQAAVGPKIEFIDKIDWSDIMIQ